MDVHRCRFVQYPTPAINALAFSHNSDAELGGSYSDLRLAVGRSNGDIEIWNPLEGAWLQETTIRGGQDRSVEGLAWTQEPVEEVKGARRSGKLRLFSIGYSSTVTEWDLSTGLPRRQSTGNHSEAWCIAAQPRKRAAEDEEGNSDSTTLSSQEIVAGCADGTIVILTTESDDLQFKKFLARPTVKRARCLSITYQNEHTVVAGFADSNIRIYDARSSTTIRNVSLGVGPSGGPRDILVWQVRCLANGDIVAGDSTGEVRFLDGKTYSIYQTLRAHEADILDLAVSLDGLYVWSTGMDRKTVTLFRSSRKGKWAEAQKATHHEHDVKAMATFEGAKISMIVSGGLDTDLVVLPMKGFNTEYHRKVSGLPQTAPVASLPSRRFLISWWERQLSIWQISKREGKPYRLRGRISLQDDEFITSATISRVSKANDVVLIGTAAGLKAFLVTHGKTTITINQISLNGPKMGVKMMTVSSNTRSLAVATLTGDISMYSIIVDSEMGGIGLQPVSHPQNRSKHKVSKARDSAALSRYLKTISRMIFSPDGQLLVFCDMYGTLNGWILSEPESHLTNGHSNEESSISASAKSPVWEELESIGTLPRLDSIPIVLTFRPPKNSAHHDVKDSSKQKPNGIDYKPSRTKDYRLVVLTARHQLHEFDLVAGTITPWSKRNQTSSLPQRFRRIRDRAHGCIWHSTSSFQRLWIWGVNWIYMFDLAADFKRIEHSNSQSKDVESEVIERTVAGGTKRVEDFDGLLPEGYDGKPFKRRRIQAQNCEVDEEDIGDVFDEDTESNNGIREVDDDSSSDEEEEDEDENEQSTEDANGIQASKTKTRHDKLRRFYFDFKYRPILGMVAMNDSSSSFEQPTTSSNKEYEEIEKQGRNRKGATTSRSAVEDTLQVVIVERPVWDLDLPARFESVAAQKRF